jgi:ornithine cyclodeaminase
VVVEFEPQARVEGEIQQLPPDFPVTEFFKIVGDEKPRRENPHQVTIFDSTGFALSDYALLRLLYDKSQEYELGTVLNLVPVEDVKNLFRTAREGVSLSGDLARTRRPRALTFEATQRPRPFGRLKTLGP